VCTVQSGGAAIVGVSDKLLRPSQFNHLPPLRARRGGGGKGRGEGGGNLDKVGVVVDEEDDAVALVPELPGQFSEEVHCGVPQPVQVLLQLDVLQNPRGK